MLHTDMVVMQRMTDYQGVSLTEAYDNRSVMAQIARIKDRLTAVEQNVDPTLRTDLEAAVAELTALEETVSGVQTQVDGNAESIGDLQDDLGTFETATNAALALKADSADVDADLELKADKTQLTDGSVTMIGTATVGTTTKPVYIKDGVPTAAETFIVNSVKLSGYSTPAKPLYITDVTDVRGPIRGGYSITNAAAQGTDNVAAHVWVGKSYMNPSHEPNASTDFMIGWQDVLLCVKETTTASITRTRIAAVSLFFGDERLIHVTKKYFQNIDKVVIAYKPGSSEFHLCMKFTRSTTTVSGRHFAGPLIGSGIDETIDRTATPTGIAWYENVTYQGEDIPNFTNYSEWSWMTIQ